MLSNGIIILIGLIPMHSRDSNLIKLLFYLIPNKFFIWWRRIKYLPGWSQKYANCRNQFIIINRQFLCITFFDFLPQIISSDFSNVKQFDFKASFTYQKVFVVSLEEFAGLHFRGLKNHHREKETTNYTRFELFPEKITWKSLHYKAIFILTWNAFKSHLNGENLLKISMEM